MAISSQTKKRFALATALRGVLMLLAGIYAIIWPLEALAVLVLFGGILLIIDGALGLWSLTFGGGKSGNYWFDVVANAASLILGVLILISPLLATIFTVTVMSTMVGIAAVFVGVMQIVVIVRERQSYARIWPLAAASLHPGLHLPALPAAQCLGRHDHGRRAADLLRGGSVWLGLAPLPVEQGRLDLTIANGDPGDVVIVPVDFRARWQTQGDFAVIGPCGGEVGGLADRHETGGVFRHGFAQGHQGGLGICRSGAAAIAREDYKVECAVRRGQATGFTDLTLWGEVAQEPQARADDQGWQGGEGQKGGQGKPVCLWHGVDKFLVRDLAARSA